MAGFVRAEDVAGSDPAQRRATAASAPDDPVLDTYEAAAFLGCSPGYLKRLRKIGGGPTFRRLFVRKGIQYPQSELVRWRSRNRYGSTSEYPESQA